MTKKLLIFIFLFILAPAAESAGAPQEKLALTGTVVDAKAASVPGAKVKLIQQSGGRETEVTTDETGAFSFDNPPPGDYTLSVIAPEFALAERKLTVGSTPVPPMQIRLEALEVTEAVTVSAEAVPFAPAQNLKRCHGYDNLFVCL